ncbi:hypothetical protein [Achromobacter sp. DH1f]|uniref:hypothetical protein n=1 Tax=Achromobacter sp. DH1f TaxID=1397275 RepID=UPI00046A2806|nr:hypothetical protein [Achromobacter sp. DH1f]
MIDKDAIEFQKAQYAIAVEDCAAAANGLLTARAYGPDAIRIATMEVEYQNQKKEAIERALDKLQSGEGLA